MGDTLFLEEFDFVYDGIFQLKSLLGAFKTWGGDNGYKVDEKGYREEVYSDGKDLEIKLSLTKGYSSEVSGVVAVKITIKKLEQVGIEIDGTTYQFKKGNLKIKYRAHVGVDEGSWNKTAFHLVLRHIMYKFFIGHFIGSAKGILKTDLRSLDKYIKSYLNLEKYRTEV
jgi:hypothetical protein